MKIITLTTDLGLNDHYVASIKGAILSQVPDAQIIDITHTVRPFDVNEAAFHVSSCYKDFPDGTIHIIGVDSEPVINFGSAGGAFPSILDFNNQYFISNDNGFFGSFLKENTPTGFYRIDNVLSDHNLFTFPTKNILTKTALRILKGEKIEDLASPESNYARAFSLVATSETNLIKGHVIHIDSYGNAITNVTKEMFERFDQDVRYTIYFKRKDYFIDTISKSYNEVPQGEKVAIFNEQNLLEIAINRAATRGTGGADKLFGLTLGDIIRVEFTPQGSHKNFDTLF